MAQVCSMLEWRPHIWITGESGSGKSTVIDKIVKKTLGPIALVRDGGTSEAGIREDMAQNGRPLIFDEAEAEDQNQKAHMEKIINLSRRASDGKTIKVSGKQPFKAQFAACFSSINPSVYHQADTSRISMLTLKKNRKRNAQQHYDEFCRKIDDVIDKNYFQPMLLTRTINHAHVLQENIEVFKRAARKCLGGARNADHVAPMLAGLWLLYSTRITDEEEAYEWMLDKGIEEQHGDEGGDSDPVRMLQHLNTSKIQVRGEHSIFDATIGQLLEAATDEKKSEISQKTADQTLRQYGIRVTFNKENEQHDVYVAKSDQNIQKLFKSTAWEHAYHRRLEDIVEAEPTKNPINFLPGNKTRAVKIPIDIFMLEYEPTTGIGDEEEKVEHVASI